jgi:hypothetical protein
MAKKIIALLLICAFAFSDTGYCLRPVSTRYAQQGILQPDKPRLEDIMSLLLDIDDTGIKEKTDFILSYINHNQSRDNVESALKIVLYREHYSKGGLLGDLGLYERLDFISECLFAALKRHDSFDLSLFLSTLLEERNDLLLAEADRLAKSFLAVYNIKTPVKVATTFAMYKGQNKIQPFSQENKIGQDFLRAKIKQLRLLYGINPNITWQLIAIQDGDDSEFSEHGYKTIDVAEQIAKENFPELLRSQGLVFLELPQGIKQKIGSVKGGANLYGMRWAIENGADYVIYTDGDLSAHLSQEGLLLEDVISGKADVSIGSIKTKRPLVSGRKFYRKILTPLYVLFAKALLPELYGISDIQRSFKCYSRDVLEIILPVDKDYNFEKYFLYDYLSDPLYLERFVYNFSFDTQLLARGRQCRFIVTQHPIAWIDFPLGSTVSKKDMFSMIKGLVLQRIYLTFYGKRYKQDARDYHAYKRIKSQRQKGNEASMSGSTKQRDLYFQDMAVHDKIKTVLENYDLGTRSVDDIEYRFLPGVPSRPPVLITTPKGKFVVKYEASNIDAVRFIVSFVKRLEDLDYPVARMLKTKKNKALDIDNYWLKAREDYFLTLEEYIEADVHKRLDADSGEMASLGSFIAKIHNQFSGFRPAGVKQEKKSIDVTAYREEIKDKYAEINALVEKYNTQEWKEYMRLPYQMSAYIPDAASTRLFKGEQLLYENFAMIDQEMFELLTDLTLEDYESLAKSIVLGDINFNNILFDKDGSIAAIFDWDKSRFQARVEDLKNPIMALPQGEGRIYSIESVIALVLGYQISADNKLSPAELASVTKII